MERDSRVPESALPRNKEEQSSLEHLHDARVQEYGQLLRLFASEAVPALTDDDQRFAEIPRMEADALRCMKYSRITPYVEATMGFSVRSAEDILSVYRVAERRKRNGATVAITTRASGFSFGEHALPPSPHTAEHRWLMTTQHLPASVAVHHRSAEAQEEGIVRVTAGAGLTFREFHAALDDERWLHVPFSVPTADGITLGGALAANTLSRSSSIDGFFLDHVHAFTLVTPRGIIRCAPDAEDPLARELFFAFPGSQGMFGCVTDITLDVQKVPVGGHVRTTVLTATGNRARFVREFLAHARDAARQQRMGETGGWDKGVYAAAGGYPGGTGRWHVYGSRANAASPQHPSFPLYGEHPTLHTWAQILSHHCPRIPQEAMRWVFPEGRSFDDPLYTYTYFQNSHPRARHSPGILGRVLPATMPVTQQTWVMHPDTLEHVLEHVRTLLCRKEFRPIAGWVELQDILLLPRSTALLSPCYDREEAIAYTISCAADMDGPRSTLVREFLSTLSIQAFARWGATVHLLKEAYCPDDLLRQMYAPALEKAQMLRATVDPHHVIRTALSDRLLLGR